MSHAYQQLKLSKTPSLDTFKPKKFSDTKSCPRP